MTAFADLEEKECAVDEQMDDLRPSVIASCRSNYSVPHDEMAYMYADPYLSLKSHRRVPVVSRHVCRLENLR